VDPEDGFRQQLSATSEKRLPMIATDRKAPESLAELATALAEIAQHIDEVTSDLDQYSFTHRSDVIVDRMEQAGVDGSLAAFNGFTHAWLLAKMPELTNEGDAVLDQMLFIEDQNYRTYVVLRLRRDGGKVLLLLPRVFDHIDRTWADRQPEEED
jgi:hypothetical protein